MLLFRNTRSKTTHVFLICALLLLASPGSAQSTHSVARLWNEVLLEAIRNDFARPVVHARNLYHVSVAQWDAWAAYSAQADAVMHHENRQAIDRLAARNEAISFASYRLIRWRFAHSPGVAHVDQLADDLMRELGYDFTFTSLQGSSPAALGNRIANTIINHGLTDGANEPADYANQVYQPVNPPILPAFPGNPDILDPNRWQPITLDVAIDQAGRVISGGSPEFLGPEWGAVDPFSLTTENLTVYHRDGFEYLVYHDPGPPPYLGSESADQYKAGFEQVALWSGLLDPADGAMINISPAGRGDNTLGSNDGPGRELNPVTGVPYEDQWVPAGDYYRVLAEFWADGPDSETPPGHWFVLANWVSDQPELEKKLGGVGPLLSDLEWDVKTYLALGGAMHDVAIAAWGVKGWYDYIRPVSAIRFMCDMGQASDPGLPSYHPDGINLYSGRIELITEESSAPGGRHEHLSQRRDRHLGKVALWAWRGPDYIDDPDSTTAGVGWIRCEDWWPYQRPSFVTPPFAGYVSGHSTYSRAAAVVLSQITGSEYFPAGMGTFKAPRNEFLVFEDGPSVDIELQWATYFDAADECSLSRIYGGIHPPADDIPGRFMGERIGGDAWRLAVQYFTGTFRNTSRLEGLREGIGGRSGKEHQRKY